MNFLVSLIIGGIVGWLGSIVMKTNAQMGMIANIIVGIIGSSLGFWIAGMLGLTIETVSRALSKLVKQELICFPQKGRRDVGIPDVGRLEAYIQQCLVPVGHTLQ